MYNEVFVSFLRICVCFKDVRLNYCNVKLHAVQILGYCLTLAKEINLQMLIPTYWSFRTKGTKCRDRKKRGRGTSPLTASFKLVIIKQANKARRE